MKIASILLTLALLNINNASAEPSSNFLSKAKLGIIESLKYDRNLFKLYNRKNRDIQFTIYDQEQGSYVTFKCDDSVYYDIASTSTHNIVGWLKIGSCINNLLLSTDVIHNQYDYYQTALDTPIGKKLSTILNDYETVRLDRNTTMDYYPVFVVGHGIGIIQTSLTLIGDGNRILITQHYGQNLCKQLAEMELCSNPLAAVKGISSKFLRN